MTFTARFNSDYSYKVALIISLTILLVSAWHAPISGDEYVHVEQARKNINYLKSLGQDKEALDTPISRLKHYGQSFDTVTTWVAHSFSIKNLYRFRHLSNAIIAWLIILFTSLTTIHLARSKWAGFLSIILILVTARFMGHATNNLKDIPFALSFITSLYFIFRFLDKLPLFSWKNIMGIMLSLAFGISIRIGGLLIFAYLVLFSSLWVYFIFQSGIIKWSMSWSIKFVAIIMTIFVFAYLLGILLWPWALEAPITNPLESLALMNHYPTTVRQIFEGKLYWSDQFPWYYLFKYLLITLPLIVLLGLGGFLVFWLRDRASFVKSIFLLIAFGFPLFYAAVTGANVYGGWRQMLFVFPFLVVLSSLGIWSVFRKLQKRKSKIVVAFGLFILLIAYPVYYSVSNFPYQYTYFNVLQGGIKGAYGKYELDYYFTSFDEAYKFIDDELEEPPKIVAANFIIPSYYDGKPYKSRLIDYYNRSVEDWDYAVVCNTFLDPWQLHHNVWPPDNTIHQINIDGMPILAILKRESKQDLEGIQLLKKGQFDLATQALEKALTLDAKNESILINLARGYFYAGNDQAMETTLSKLFEIYPTNEWGKDLDGELKMRQGKFELAKQAFAEIIDDNYKFFHAYVNLAKTYLALQDEEMAISLLKTCLRINPYYVPAYQTYGHILIERGEVDLGKKMLEFTVEGNSKYGRK
jgi:tetratricopeptide (TPR) repeat protein